MQSEVTSSARNEMNYVCISIPLEIHLCVYRRHLLQCL